MAFAVTIQPQPPQGYQLVIQERRPDGGVVWLPSVPAQAIPSLLVWDPWTGRWNKPKYLCRDRDAILCCDERLG